MKWQIYWCAGTVDDPIDDQFTVEAVSLADALHQADALLHGTARYQITAIIRVDLDL